MAVKKAKTIVLIDDIHGSNFSISSIHATRVATFYRSEKGFYPKLLRKKTNRVRIRHPADLGSDAHGIVGGLRGFFQTGMMKKQQHDSTAPSDEQHR